MAIHSSIDVAGNSSAPRNESDTSNTPSTYTERDECYAHAINSRGYQILEEPLGTKRRIKVIVLGAGASGIDFFKNAEERLENVEIQCYEKNGDIGGTVSKQLRGNYRRTAENSLAA